MGSGRKRAYFLIAVVLLLTAVGRAGYLYWDWTSNRQRLTELLDLAQRYAAAEVLSAYYRNFSLAARIAGNLEFEKAFALRDRKAMDKVILSVISSGAGEGTRLGSENATGTEAVTPGGVEKKSESKSVTKGAADKGARKSAGKKTHPPARGKDGKSNKDPGGKENNSSQPKKETTQASVIKSVLKHEAAGRGQHGTSSDNGEPGAADSAALVSSTTKCSAAVILQDNWTIFYSNDLEDLAEKRELALEPLDYPLAEKAIDFEFPPGPENPFPCGLWSLCDQNNFALSSLVPLKEKNKPIAVLAVNTPFDADLLEAIEQRTKSLRSDQNNLGIALFVMLGTRLTASSTELKKSQPSYLTSLTHATSDPFQDRTVLTESDGRLWKNLPLWGPDGQRPMGQVIICASLSKPPSITDPLGLGALCAALGLLLIAGTRAATGSRRQDIEHSPSSPAINLPKEDEEFQD